MPGITHCEEHMNPIGLGYVCEECEKERDVKLKENKKMTNREWLLNKMQNMSDGELCDLLRPCNFGKYAHVEYESKYEGCMCNWLDSEHKEPITLSEAERIILENGNKDFNWIARDKSGALYVYTEKPRKNDTIWENTSRSFELTYFNHLFQFITWNDSEPYNVEELLKGE